MTETNAREEEAHDTTADAGPAAFRAQLGTMFRVDDGAEGIQLRLAEVEDERIGGGMSD
jgi:hypothetical protein